MLDPLPTSALCSAEVLLYKITPGRPHARLPTHNSSSAPYDFRANVRSMFADQGEGFFWVAHALMLADKGARHIAAQHLANHKVKGCALDPVHPHQDGLSQYEVGLSFPRGAGMS